ncbi:MAG: hypothetical protein V4843_09360 [Pseudomonadota bacterium]
MQSIGIIAPERLALLPPKYWKAHEFCFHLHDQMVQLLIQYEESGAHNLVLDAIRRALADSGVTHFDVDPLQLLKERDLVQPYRHLIVSHLTLGLTSDMLHFIFEALTCFEKRKFAVGFALLRKPLKENLLFLSWLLADEDDFITRFESNTSSTMNGVQPERRVEILSAAVSRLAVKDAFAGDFLNDLIFSKSHERSFEPLWQRASHLVTSQGSQLRTEDLNINFIFHDARSDHLFELLYENLPYLLLYAVQVSLECFAKISRSNEQTASHLVLSTLGCFEALFANGRDKPVTKLLSESLRPFLKCVHCKAPLRLHRANAAQMYLRETLTCNRCNLTSSFPLYWILAQGELKITRDDGTTPILERPWE